MRGLVPRTERLKALFPVRYGPPVSWDYPDHVFKSFGLQRSGQHLVIEWICRGLQDVSHLNNCGFRRRGATYELRPRFGRQIVYSGGVIRDSRDYPDAASLSGHPNAFFSIEDLRLSGPLMKKLDRSHVARTILIMRDPCNWLASSLEHGRSYAEVEVKRDTLIEYLEEAISPGQNLRPDSVPISYNEFILSRSYRQDLARKLSLPSFVDAEVALGNVPDFGGGSSFSDGGGGVRTLSRWTKYSSDTRFHQTLNHPRLIELAMAFFGNPPGFEELGLT